MMFKYDKEVSVGDDEDVLFEIKHPDNGTASQTTIDLPGPYDKQCTNECKKNLGKGSDLKAERTVVFSKAVNMDINNKNVRLDFFINDILIVSHSNPKSQDESPLIKINIKFI